MKRIKMKKMVTLVREWIGALIIAVIVVALFSYILWPMRVKGHSMEPGLSEGNFILVSKISCVFQPLKMGDLVVAELDEEGKRIKIVKRIIGVAGDHVVIKDGQVLINSQVLLEPYAISETLGVIDLFVPKDAYFLLGDHREVSKDSRVIGCVFSENIKGKVIF